MIAVIMGHDQICRDPSENIEIRLLPGIHATDRADALDKGVAAREGISLEEARARREASLPVGRYGTSEEFGATCAFLCSQHAGFIVGQNILLDGGGVNSTL